MSRYDTLQAAAGANISERLGTDQQQVNHRLHGGILHPRYRVAQHEIPRRYAGGRPGVLCPLVPPAARQKRFQALANLASVCSAKCSDAHGGGLLGGVEGGLRNWVALVFESQIIKMKNCRIKNVFPRHARKGTYYLEVKNTSARRKRTGWFWVLGAKVSLTNRQKQLHCSQNHPAIFALKHSWHCGFSVGTQYLLTTVKHARPRLQISADVSAHLREPHGRPDRLGAPAGYARRPRLPHHPGSRGRVPPGTSGPAHRQVAGVRQAHPSASAHSRTAANLASTSDARGVPCQSSSHAFTCCSISRYRSWVSSRPSTHSSG